MAVKSKIVMYADDTLVVSSNKVIFILSDQILNQLHLINEWFGSNVLKTKSGQDPVHKGLNNSRSSQLDSTFLP